VKQPQKETLFAGLFAVLFAMALGFSIAGPVNQITNALASETHTKVLYIASYNDYYKFDVNDYLRSILGRRLALVGEIVVEGNYDEILARASLGTSQFLEYLKSNKVTHLLLPKATYDTSAIFHRWSNHGTINISLDQSVFTLEAMSGGDSPLALLKINYGTASIGGKAVPNYEIKWSGVREDFYVLKRAINEDYFTTYARGYPERIDVSWVLHGENAQLTLVSNSSDQLFNVEIEFIAAYGENAPPQLLRVVSNSESQIVSLFPNVKQKVIMKVLPGDEISITNILGCNIGTSFDPTGTDSRNFCYGVSDVRVELVDSE
jgi:hypothetical protein